MFIARAKLKEEVETAKAQGIKRGRERTKIYEAALSRLALKWGVTEDQLDLSERTSCAEYRVYLGVGTKEYLDNVDFRWASKP